MTDEEKQKRIVAALENSDIVWPRYGSESIEELAARIVRRLKDE